MVKNQLQKQEMLIIDGSENTNEFILIKDNGSIKEVNIDDNAFSRITVSESNDIIIYDIYNIYIYINNINK